MPDQPRRFYLDRDTDITGVSGTGHVADGVLWADGTASVRWLGEHPSAVFWDRGRASVELIHGHGGATRVVWLDNEPAPTPNLDALRAKVQEIVRSTNRADQSFRWRVIGTDTESDSGVALVCTASGDEDEHQLVDLGNEPVRDESSVYDCCPWPQMETWSEPFAAYLVALLNADTGQAGA